MLLKVFIIYLSDLIFYTNGFYKDHIKLYFNISVQGKTDYAYSFTYAHLRYNMPSCDHGLLWPNWKCDPKIYSMSVVSNLMSPEEFKKRSIDLTDEYYYEHYDLNKVKWKSLGFSFEDSNYLYFHNQNTIYYWKPWPYKSDFFLKIIGVCMHAVHNAFFWKIYFGTDCIYRYLPKFNVWYDIDFNYNYQGNRFTFQVSAGCQVSYFEPTCWRQCVAVTNRLLCDPDGNEVCNGSFEHLVVNYGYWNILEVYQTVFFEKKYIKKCIFLNLCLNANPCSNSKELCFPLDNNSMTCIIFTLSYVIAQYSNVTNATFESILNTEFVEIRLTFEGRASELIENHSYCTWEHPNNWRYKLFKIENNGYLLSYPLSIQYGLYKFSIDCNLGNYLFFLYNKTFVIHIVPNDIFLFNASLGNKYRVFYGQTISCKSDAIPQNISLHEVFLKSDNFNPNPRISSKELYIPLFARTGFCVLQCNHTFIFPDNRIPYRSSRVINGEIKPYVYFTWKNNFKNQYGINDFTGCIYLTYFEAAVNIEQLSGPSHVVLSPFSNFSLNVLKGGVYVFICRLYDVENTIYFIKSKTIEITMVINFYCIMPFYPTLGSLILFSHNGYPPDETYFTLSLFNNNEEVSFSSHNYIRIPYDAVGTKMILIGKLLNLINPNLNVPNIRNEIILFSETEKEVIISPEDFTCADLSETEIRYHQLSKSTLLFYAELHYLLLHHLIWLEFIYLLLILPLYGMLILIVEIKKHKSTSFIADRRRATKYRELNDIVQSSSKLDSGCKVLEAQMEKFNLCTKCSD